MTEASIAEPTAVEPHAADRLLAAIERKRAPVCVGIDPVLARLPAALRPQDASDRAAAEAIGLFGEAILEAVAPHVPCVKLQAACFERYRTPGMQSLFRLLATARARRLEVILDAKRGDIGISAEHYAAAYVRRREKGAGEPGEADWITLNAYLGADGIQPFLAEGQGAFALVRTSNPGGDVVQGVELRDGRTVAEAVAEMVADIGAASVGRRGFSALGAVVGATRPQAAARLRRIMAKQILLVPGFGAQGGGVDDVRPCFHGDGSGAIVAASRSVIYAFDPDDPEWPAAIAAAAERLAGEVGEAVGLR